MGGCVGWPVDPALLAALVGIVGACAAYVRAEANRKEIESHKAQLDQLDRRSSGGTAQLGGSKTQRW